MSNEKSFIQRSTTLMMKLSDVAKWFDLLLEADSHEDVYHNGYSIESTRKMDLILPPDLEDVNKYFPLQVAIALEDAERDGYASALTKARIEILKETLLKIDLSGGGAEYEESEGNFVSTKAGITDVEIDSDNDEIKVSILNPEHLINTVLCGEGVYGAELSAFDPASDSELISRFHNLKKYFAVYGESLPSVPDRLEPNVDDDYFCTMIKERLGDLSLSEVAEAVIDLAERSEDEVDVQNFLKFLDEKYTADSVKKEIDLLLKSKNEKIKKQIV